MAEYQFDEPHYHDADAAREYLESLRWPSGPVCPHCGAVDHIYAIQGKSHRAGLYECGHCTEQFTVTVGTVFEDSKLPLHKWLLAAAMMASSKKGVSSKQIERMLGVTYKTAWFMTHRLREAMKSPGGMMGGNGGIIEADETFIGGKEKNKHADKKLKQGRGAVGKQAVFSLVERGGNVHSHHVTNVTAQNLKPILIAHTEARTHLMTDEAGQYRILGKHFAKHSSVNHSAGEYVRGTAHTNTVESYFAILKRGVYGTFHNVSEQHLHRYLTEFDFRYNHRQVPRQYVPGSQTKWTMVGPNDHERTEILLKGISGKRLTYRRTCAAA